MLLMVTDIWPCGGREAKENNGTWGFLECASWVQTLASLMLPQEGLEDAAGMLLAFSRGEAHIVQL